MRQSDEAAMQGQRFTAKQAQDFLGVGPATLKTLRKRRVVKFYRVGWRTVSYDAASLARFLRSREQRALGDAG